MKNIDTQPYLILIQNQYQLLYTFVLYYEQYIDTNGVLGSPEIYFCENSKNINVWRILLSLALNYMMINDYYHDDYDGWCIRNADGD